MITFFNTILSLIEILNLYALYCFNILLTLFCIIDLITLLAFTLQLSLSNLQNFLQKNWTQRVLLMVTLFFLRCYLTAFWMQIDAFIIKL